MFRVLTRLRSNLISLANIWRYEQSGESSPVVSKSGIDTVFAGSALTKGKSLIVCFIHNTCADQSDQRAGIRMCGCAIPLLSKEARNPSWPEPKAGWIPGRPPSEPRLLTLYL